MVTEGKMEGEDQQGLIAKKKKKKEQKSKKTKETE